MSTLNLILQTLHNLGRWVFLAAALVVILRGLIGWAVHRAWAAKDDRTVLTYTILLDVQVLLGVILYFTKGWGSALIGDPSSAMTVSAIRFFAVEHLAVMLLATAAAHIGRARLRKFKSDAGKHMNSAFWALVALLMVLVAVPWPFYSSGRPLLRLLGISF